MTENKHMFPGHPAFLITDLLSLTGAFLTAFRIRYGTENFFASETRRVMLLTVLLLDLIITLVSDPYHGIYRRSYYQEIIRCLRLAFYNLLFAAVIFALLKIDSVFSREMMITAYVLYFFISVLAKYIQKKLIVSRYEKSITPLFLIGSRRNIESVAEDVNASEFPLYDIRGILLTDDPDRSIRTVRGIPVIGSAVTEFILENRISEVLVTVPPVDIDPALTKALNANGVSVCFDIDAITGFHPEHTSLHNFGIRQGLSAGKFTFSPAQSWYLVFKRIPDALFGLTGCFLLIPAYLIIRAAYLLSGDRNGILFTQERIGFKGKPIRIYKFRSMVPNAEEKLGELLSREEYRREWEENQKLEDDPRITGIGRFLRQTSFDEMPQMINVLRGEMSLIGPRPLVEGELEAHNGMDLYRRVKPGITGWWACNGRSGISYQERLELEYYYVKHVSLYLDLICLLRTAFSVLWQRGSR